MLANIKKLLKRNQRGMSVVELIISIVVISILIIPTMTVMIYFFGDTLKNNAESRLAVESQSILRSITEELRISAGVRAASTITDPNHTGPWTTSESDVVLIMATPVLNASNEFVIDPLTGAPYFNELIYFKGDDNTLYKRYLANSSATGNPAKTSCPANLATAGCPADAVLSKHFESMDFTFYDTDNVVTTDPTLARAIQMTINMQQKVYGQTITFSHTIKVTLRNLFS